MRKYKIMFVLAIGLAGAKKISAQEPSRPRSFLQVSPLAGINLDKKIFVYGGEVGYEYRLNNRWSAIGNAMFSTGSTNSLKTLSAGTTSLMVNHQRVNEYAVSLGIKYYIGNFYVSGGIGYGKYEQISEGRYDYPGIEPSNATPKEGTMTRNGIYQNYEIGYSIPLKNQNNLQIFMKGYGTRDMNLGTGIRYSFGLGKNK